jgi:calcineurin-like phosphoesterase family protein
MSRIVDLEWGRVMVVADLHGDYPVYCRYRDRFLELRARGQANVLVFIGDLIHTEGPRRTDGSLEIVLDLLRLRRDLGDGLIVLLGNHEMPHLYGIAISKGGNTYTPQFEIAMSDHRPEIVAFFDGMPFYVRTRAGVTIAHAGASRAASTPDGLQRLADYSHSFEMAKVDALLEGQDRVSVRAGLAKLSGQDYAEMVAQNIGISDPNDPRYDDVLRGVLVTGLSSDFQRLWEACFNKNEQQYGPEEYARLLGDTLAALSEGFVRQRVIVSGHIPVMGGYEVVLGRQLRLASWAHATPPEAGRYLLFDAGRPISSVEALIPGLHSVLTPRLIGPL